MNTEFIDLDPPVSTKTNSRYNLDIYEGYVWELTPTCKESTEGFGYHGNDCPPSNAEYLYDKDEEGYFVITPNKKVPILVEGWKIAEANIEEDFYQYVGVYLVKAIYQVENNGKWILVGYLAN